MRTSPPALRAPPLHPLLQHCGKHALHPTDPDAREIVYGMPYKEWQAKHQKEASADQKAAFAKANPNH